MPPNTAWYVLKSHRLLASKSPIMNKTLRHMDQVSIHMDLEQIHMDGE